jgi:hemolysin activation/secretion protein
MKIRFRRLLAGTVAAALILPAGVAIAQDAVGRFDISRFEVQGNTLLETATIERLLAQYTGQARDFGDVQMALEALEAAYRARGYNVVQVALPEQELNQGVVKLQVIETRLGAVRVEGNAAFSEANIRASLPGLREGESPNLGKVSSSLRLANENPAKKTTLQLQNSDKDDEINALLKVSDDKPWRIGTSVDNSGNKTTGEAQLTVQYQHANIADRDHVLSLQYTTAIENPSQVSVYGAGYHIPLYAWGDSIDLFASYSDVDSGSVLAGIFNLQVSGRGTVAGARYNQILRRVGDYESRLSYGIDHKAFQNNVALQGVPNSQLGNDITVHPLSVTYGGNWAAGGNEASFSIGAVRNIPGGDKGGSADFQRARAGAPDDYSILRYSAGYGRSLAGDWQLRFNLSGQETGDALIPGEQFGAGGASSVRGFAERDLSNDSGRMFSAEIYTPNLCGGVQKVAAQCRTLAFFDTANVRRNDALPGEQRTASIASVGLGLRLAVSKYMTMQMDYGRVLDGGATKADGDDRLHVKLALSY